MFTIYKNALERVKADDALKQNTAAYLMAQLAAPEASSARIRASAPPRMKRLAVALCAAAVLIILPVSGYALYQAPVSYLSVDINPSVELGINTFGRVVSVTAYNDDGKTVIDGLALKHLKVGNAVTLIVDAAAENGFIQEDGSSVISLTAETNNDQVAEKLEQDAQAGAEEAIETKDDEATVVTDQIALDRRADAISLGITPGKLNLIEKLQALDPAIKTEDYKDASVKEIQKKFIELQKAQNDGKIDEDTATDITVKPSPSSSSAASPDAVSSPAPSATNNNNGNHNGNANKPEKPNKDGSKGEKSDNKVDKANGKDHDKDKGNDKDQGGKQDKDRQVNAGQNNGNSKGNDKSDGNNKKS